MGIQDLQTLLENEGVSVDLFRIRRTHAGGFKLVLDAEGCLDRLYGGYFSDWACGGQWARCVQFLVTLKTALAEHQVSVCVCFDGAHPAPTTGPPPQWLQTQAASRQKINSVLKHIGSKGTPPPKVWWVPPAGLHSCLRNALRYLNVSAMVSTEDHHLETVGLCWEKGFAGIIGYSGEYLIFQPPRYFCSSRLKLTYRSSLETKEYMVQDLGKLLDVPHDRLCIVAALLGNTILTEQDLSDFHTKLSKNQNKITGEQLIKSVAAFVKEFPNKDLEALAAEIFGDANDQRSARFKQSVQYFINGTKEGFLKYKTSAGAKPKSKKFGLQAAKETDLDTSRLASEANAPEIGEFKLDSSLTYMAGEWPESATDTTPDSDKKGKSGNGGSKGSKDGSKVTPLSPFPVEVLRTASERHSKGLMTPSLLTILQHRQIALPVLMEDENHRELPSLHHLFRPIRQNVYAILFNMHHFHFMATKGKEQEKQTPPTPVSISEWIYSRQNPGKTPEAVQGIMLDWPVPTVQRLWFGVTQDDKCRRLRAFLSCMRSDNQLMLNTAYVPQHLLVLACVLRYIMTSPIPCLRRQELDAFLATAFATDLMNPLHLQEMALSNITVRGVQLGAMIMTGIDAALLANDACGAPVWWPFSSPWLYFDGKLFQQKLAKANTVKNLAQLCDNHVEIVIKVERMRKAILEGLDVEFAIPQLPLNPNVLAMGYPPAGMLNWNNPKSRGSLNNTHRNAGGRLEIAGVVVGQWGANYPRSAQTTRYNQSQMGYHSYQTQQHGTYGSRGRGRGRPATVGRGGLARRTRHRTTRPQGTRRQSNKENGKSSTEDKNSNGSNDGMADSTTDLQNEQSDNGESPDSNDNSNSGDGGGKSAKLNKNKKNPVKGKKKVPQKDSVKADEKPAEQLPNGQTAENCSISGVKNKIPGKTVGLVNGSNGTNGEHKSSDSPIHE